MNTPISMARIMTIYDAEIANGGSADSVFYRTVLAAVEADRVSRASITPTKSRQDLITLNEQMADALDQIAEALRGPPAQGRAHGWPDLPAHVAALVGVLQDRLEAPDASAQARAAALEEAALLVEGRRDLARQISAGERVRDAAAEGDEVDELSRLRHESDVSLFNAALSRAAAAIRTLSASPAPEAPVVRVPMTEKEIVLASLSVKDPLEFGRILHGLQITGPVKNVLISYARVVEAHHGIGSELRKIETSSLHAIESDCGIGSAP